MKLHRSINRSIFQILFQAKDLANIPPVEEIITLIMAENTSAFCSAIGGEKTINLIHWILSNSRYNFETISKNRFKDVLSLCKVARRNFPNYVVKVNYAGEESVR